MSSTNRNIYSPLYVVGLPNKAIDKAAIDSLTDSLRVSLQDLGQAEEVALA